MQKLKIAIIGYGKMGQMIEQLATQRGHAIVSIIQKDNQKEFDSTAFKSADVAIEFSTPTSAYANLKACFERCIPVVCGTTAWLDKLEDIQQLCSEHQGCFCMHQFQLR